MGESGRERGGGGGRVKDTQRRKAIIPLKRTFVQICLVEFLSLSVAVSSLIVSKSTVMPNGIPTSSVRA